MTSPRAPAVNHMANLLCSIDEGLLYPRARASLGVPLTRELIVLTCSETEFDEAAF